MAITRLRDGDFDKRKFTGACMDRMDGTGHRRRCDYHVCVWVRASVSIDSRPSWKCFVAKRVWDPPTMLADVARLLVFGERKLAGAPVDGRSAFVRVKIHHMPVLGVHLYRKHRPSSGAIAGIDE